MDDAVLVNPGGRVPVDGVVLGGHSFVDESRITGESMPVEKTAGSPVYAGSINQSGALEVRVERIGRDTSYGKIIEAVERAERSRAPVQRLADRLAGYLVYFALGRSRAHLADYRAICARRSRSSSSRAPAASLPARRSPFSARSAARRGWARSSRAGSTWKRLAQVDTVVLDKTGTLTFGRPEVQRSRRSKAASADAVLDAAAAAEARSEHPLGQAIVVLCACTSARHRRAGAL